MRRVVHAAWPSLGALALTVGAGCRIPEESPPAEAHRVVGEVTRAAPPPQRPLRIVAEVTGSVGLEIAQATLGLTERKDALDRCGATAQAEATDGRARLRLELSPEGRVARVVIAPDVPGGPRVKDCVHDALKGAQFAAPAAGEARVDLELQISTAG